VSDLREALFEWDRQRVVVVLTSAAVVYVVGRLTDDFWLGLVLVVVSLVALVGLGEAARRLLGRRDG
jgi:formylmethanofuran dehydrogenase subunit E-like metal-binding protein